jgi:hypothetical protein
MCVLHTQPDAKSSMARFFFSSYYEFSAALKGRKNRLPRSDLNLGLKLVGQTNLADIAENLGNLAAGVCSFQCKRVVGEHVYSIAYIVPKQTYNQHLTHKLAFKE